MHRALLDALRCPRLHDESWIVAVVHRGDGIHLLDADLACPVCGGEFPVRDGIADFGEPPRRASSRRPDPMRLAALLGVTSSAPVLLTGAYAYAGAALGTLVDAPQVWLDAPVDAPTTVTSSDARAEVGAPVVVSRLQGAARLPLGVDTLAAAAVDLAHSEAGMLASILRALRQGARLVAPAQVPLPAGVRELARDETEWVAETTARGSGLVELRRRLEP